MGMLRLSVSFFLCLAVYIYLSSLIEKLLTSEEEVDNDGT